METNKSETKSLSIRIPLQMLEEIKQVAQQHNRSINGEILTAIAEHLKKSKKHA
jgi:hypothetical protein